MIEVLNPLTISDWMRLQVTRSRKVGNALKGATFISTTAGKADGSYRNVLCQCPEWGDLHFHALEAKEVYIKVACVNALNGATFISTDEKKVA